MVPAGLMIASGSLSLIASVAWIISMSFSGLTKLSIMSAKGVARGSQGGQANQQATQKKRGRPKADDKTREEFNQAKQTADEIKSALYALGKAPENLTENQRHKVELIARTSKVLFRCYTSKEALRLILKMTDPQQASQELKSWYYRARHSRIDELKNLAAKIRRHEQNILNSITLK